MYRRSKQLTRRSAHPIELSDDDYVISLERTDGRPRPVFGGAKPGPPSTGRGTREFPIGA